MSKNNTKPRLPQGLSRSQLTDKAVLEALSKVPRHLFVPADVRASAYSDCALPIGHGQTISQPFIVALMSQEAHIQEGFNVLEIGTGSGYQAAVLAELGAKVLSFEIVPELAKSAQELLSTMGYTSVRVIEGDGWEGCNEEAPFDAILVTAASPRLPEKLIEQLADSGRMLIPLEQERGFGENLLLIEKKHGEVKRQQISAVKFVPLTGKGRGTEE